MSRRNVRQKQRAAAFHADSLEEELKVVEKGCSNKALDLAVSFQESSSELVRKSQCHASSTSREHLIFLTRKP